MLLRCVALAAWVPVEIQGSWMRAPDSIDLHPEFWAEWARGWTEKEGKMRKIAPSAAWKVCFFASASEGGGARTRPGEAAWFVSGWGFRIHGRWF